MRKETMSNYCVFDTCEINEPHDHAIIEPEHPAHICERDGHIPKQDFLENEGKPLIMLISKSGKLQGTVEVCKRCGVLYSPDVEIKR
jgi:hypothetical protein